MKKSFFGFSSILPNIFSYIWPIKRSEHKKFLSMFSIFFLLSFNYNALRAVKDTLVVTAPSSGAEAIPFIKVWVMLPMALLITIIFTRLSRKYGRDKVFYLMMIIFLGFFAIFIIFLYPNRNILHPTHLADYMETLLPKGFHGFIAVFRNWTLTSFYVMAELWGTMMLNVLFWGFANDITEVGQAKRFYSLLGVGANISGALAGQAIIFLSRNTFNTFLNFGNTAWEQSVLYLNIMIIVIGLIIMLIFRYLNKKVIVSSEPLLDKNVEWKSKTKKPFLKSFKFLSKSKYLIYIAIIVITYNIAINLIEVVWKKQVQLLYPNPSDYNIYMGKVMTIMGLLATLIAVFISGNLLRKFSWTVTALIPPIIIGITGVGFFYFFLVKKSMLMPLSGMTPLAMCVFFGSMQNCVSRALKYTLFDTTKEISFIPLSREDKLNGKAAIDGVGSRIGKSGGSIIHQGLIIIFCTISASAPIIAFLFIGIISIWIVSVKSLGKEFHKLVDSNEKTSISTPPDLKKEPSPLAIK